MGELQIIIKFIIILKEIFGTFEKKNYICITIMLMATYI